MDTRRRSEIIILGDCVTSTAAVDLTVLSTGVAITGELAASEV